MKARHALLASIAAGAVALVSAKTAVRSAPEPAAKGLTAAQMDAGSSSASFTLDRDAGRVSFEGSFRGGEGAGHFTSASSTRSATRGSTSTSSSACASTARHRSSSSTCSRSALAGSRPKTS